MFIGSAPLTKGVYSKMKTSKWKTVILILCYFFYLNVNFLSKLCLWNKSCDWSFHASFEIDRAQIFKPYLRPTYSRRALALDMSFSYETFDPPDKAFLGLTGP